MKTEEELNAVKEEVEIVSEKLHDLTEKELAHVNGGDEEKTCPKDKAYPTRSCNNESCPYRSGSRCNLYNEYIPSIRPRPLY